MLKTSLGRFRLAALAEGTSYLLLLFVAMPLKYGLDMPMGVRIMGRIHGGLFFLFLATLIFAAVEDKWSPLKVLTGFIASLLPFGAFAFDAKIKNDDPKEQS